MIEVDGNRLNPRLSQSALPDDAPGLEAMARLRFWELEPLFRCPVVGICLSSVDQHRLIKKAGLQKKKRSAFEIHELLVASSENENRLSQCVDRLLHHRHGQDAKALMDLDLNAYMSRFDADFDGGRLAAAVWSAAVHPALGVERKRIIFGRIHMWMHTSAETRAALVRKLQRAEQRNIQLRQSLKAADQRRRVQEKMRRQVEAELARQRMQTIGGQASMIDPNCVRQKDGAACCVREVSREWAEIKEQIKRAERYNARLSEQNCLLSEQVAQQQALSKGLREECCAILESRAAAMNHCDSDCPAFDLCQKRVLIVGGLTRMQSLYRSLIERNGGIFEYHDGYMKKGQRELEVRLKRADVVLCPVGCNSHAACARVKRLARKHKKTVHMLANSSLSAVSRVFRDGTARGRIN